MRSLRSDATILVNLANHFLRTLVFSACLQFRACLLPGLLIVVGRFITLVLNCPLDVIGQRHSGAFNTERQFQAFTQE